MNVCMHACLSVFMNVHVCMGIDECKYVSVCVCLPSKCQFYQIKL